MGLKDWLFEIAERLLALTKDEEGTASTMAKARELESARGKSMVTALGSPLTGR